MFSTCPRPGAMTWLVATSAVLLMTIPALGQHEARHILALAREYAVLDGEQEREWHIERVGEIAGQIDGAAALLVVALRDESAAVRLSAVKALGRLKERIDANAIAALAAKSLNDSSLDVEVAACNVLAAQGTRAVVALVEAAKDGTTATRTNAAWTLGEIATRKEQNRRALEIRVILPQFDRDGREQTELAGTLVRRVFRDFLDDPRIEVRRAALRACAKSSELATSLMDKIAERLDAEESALRAEAARACARAQLNDNHLPLLESHLDDAQPRVRIALALAIAAQFETHRERSLNLLLAEARNPDAIARREAIDSLALLGSKAASSLDMVRALLEAEEDADNRRAIALAEEKIRGSASK